MAVVYATVDGQMVVSGTHQGPAETLPAQIRLRYAVDNQLAAPVTIDVSPGDRSGNMQEWSAVVPAEVPQLVDDDGQVLVTFYEFAAFTATDDAGFEYAHYDNLAAYDAWGPGD